MADCDSPPPQLGCQMSYVSSIPAILKLFQIASSLGVFISASLNSVWILPQFGGGFVQFVSILAVILCSALFLFKVSNVISKIPGPITLIEFIFYIFMDLCYAVCGFLSAVRAAQTWVVYYPDRAVPHSRAAIAFASGLSFACLGLFVVGTLFAYKQWRSGTIRQPTVYEVAHSSAPPASAPPASAPPASAPPPSSPPAEPSAEALQNDFSKQ